MSDVTITEPEAPAQPDTPTSPEADTPTTPEVNWQERYEHLQPEYTRATQTLSDEEALIAHIAEKFPHLLDEEDDDDPDLDDPAPLVPPSEQPQPHEVRDPRVDEILAQQGQERYEKDIAKAVGERELSDLGREWLDSKLQADEIKGPEDLNKFVARWFEHEDSLKPAPKKPRTPHVPTGGTAPGGPDKPWEDMTPTERDHAMVARLQAEAH